MIERSRPGGSLSKAKRAEFVAQLEGQDRELWNEAVEWYDRLYGPAPVARGQGGRGGRSGRRSSR